MVSLTMPDHCHSPLFCKYLCITSMCCIDASLCFIFSVHVSCAAAFNPFGCLEDKPEIDDDIFFRHFARLRWLLVVEEGNCVACRASHAIELPCQTPFVLFFLFFLLVCFPHLSILLLPMCVILVV